MTWLRPAAFAAATLLGAGACSSGSNQAQDPADPPSGPAPADAPVEASGTGSAPADPAGSPAAETSVPDVEVLDVASGEAVGLRSLAQGRATLFWFWAPH